MHQSWVHGGPRMLLVDHEYLIVERMQGEIASPPWIRFIDEIEDKMGRFILGCPYIKGICMVGDLSTSHHLTCSHTNAHSNEGSRSPYFVLSSTPYFICIPRWCMTSPTLLKLALNRSN